MSTSKKENITIICERETKCSLKKFFSTLNSKIQFEFQCFKAEDENSLREAILGKYYICAVLVLPYSPQNLMDMLGINDFIIFSQRIARHHICYYHWCKEKNLPEYLEELYSALKYRIEMSVGHQLEKSRANEILKNLSSITKKYKELFKRFKWEIWFVDDEIEGKEKEYYEFLKERIRGFLDLKNEDNFKVFRDLKGLKTDLQNVDIIFIDLMFGRSPEGVLECLPYLTKFRGVNRFPIIIGLSRIETQEWVWAFLKKGADAFIPKDQFLYLLSMGREAFFGFIAQCLLKDIDLWHDNQKFAENIKLCDGLDGSLEGKEEKFLIKRIFYPYTRYLRKEEKFVLEGRIVSGRSGAITLKITPKIRNMMFHPRFVKIDSSHKMIFEKYAFEKYIRGNLENFCGRIDEPVAYGKRYSAIAYTGIGIPEDYEREQILPFSNFLLTRSKEEIKVGLETLFGKILINLHGKIKIEKENDRNLDLKEFLAKFYPLTGEGEFNGFGNGDEFEILEAEEKVKKEDKKNDKQFFLQLKVWDGKGVYKVRVQEIEEEMFPLLALFFRPGKRIRAKWKKHKCFFQEDVINGDGNKYKWKEQKLMEKLLREINNKFKTAKKARERACKNRLKNGWYAIIHGDLNLDAIQYTPPWNFWLIDFAKTQKGYVAIDYVKLEMEIRTHLISDYLYNFINSPLGPDIEVKHIEKILKDIETRLVEEKFDIVPSFELFSPWLSEHELLRNLYFAINYIRHLFWVNYRRCSKNAEKGNAWKEYLCTLVHYAIETTKFKNLKEPWENKNEKKNNSKSAPLPLLLSLITAEIASNGIDRKDC